MINLLADHTIRAMISARIEQVNRSRLRPTAAFHRDLNAYYFCNVLAFRIAMI
jgi:hypothetical protein